MKLKGTSFALVSAVAGVAAGSLILAGIASHYHIFGGDSGELLLHTDLSDASATRMPLDVKEIFKGREKAGDAAAGSNYLAMQDEFVDDENHCEFCIAVEYKPGPQGKALVAFKADKPYDLSEASKLTFIARGENGGESIKVFVGGVKAINLDKNIAPTDYEKAKEIKFAMSSQFVLTKEWQTYEVDLENADLSAVTHAFAFEVQKGTGNERQVIYLNSIFYIE